MLNCDQNSSVGNKQDLFHWTVQEVCDHQAAKGLQPQALLYIILYQLGNKLFC